MPSRSGGVFPNDRGPRQARLLGRKEEANAGLLWRVHRCSQRDGLAGLSFEPATADGLRAELLLRSASQIPSP